MASIDRVDWHLNEDYPENLPEENSGTHIGMYLAWIINNDLISDFHKEESKEGVENVRSRSITGRAFLFDYCDGKFWEQELNRKGLDFTKYYYESGGYFNDYTNLLASNFDSVFQVNNSWDNYEKLKLIIDKQYSKWEMSMNKKWWEFWK
ncbi:MAG: hypothetical protein N4A35_02470 [Flavobacteriales bacterium]|jgi:hypothetical protein|nr:hypothetical protein [Flavobacteriales bacterium]